MTGLETSGLRPSLDLHFSKVKKPTVRIPFLLTNSLSFGARWWVWFRKHWGHRAAVPCVQVGLAAEEHPRTSWRPALLPAWLVTYRDALSYFRNRIINTFTQ